MSSIMHIQVETRGRITIPAAWRQENHIEAGDMVTLTELGNGVILMRARPSRANHLANKIADELRRAGITLTDLLEELRQIRK